jgi:GAF domain-containing protein
MIMRDLSHLVPTARAGLVHPAEIAVGLAALVLLALLFWNRDRRLRGQRERLRGTYELGEQILSASSIEPILSEISEALPRILGISRVHLYVFNRGANTLDSVMDRLEAPTSIPLSAPAGPHAGAVACFHYRTLLAIPDVERSPFPVTRDSRKPPKSVLFVPMLSQGEVEGVLELLQDDRARDFTADEQAWAQHQRNPIGAAGRL